MKEPSKFHVDRRLLEEHQAKLRGEVEGHWGSWATRQFLKSCAAGLVIFLSVQLLFGDEPTFAQRLSHLRVVLILIEALVFGLLTTGWGAWQMRRHLRLATPQLAARIEQDHLRLTEQGWPRYVVGIGAKLALGVGVPVGILFSLLPIPASLGTRVSMFLAFLGMTVVWALPFAFWLRWTTLRLHRRWVPEH